MIELEYIKDNRTFLKKILCKLIHKNERYIDGIHKKRNKYKVYMAHKCFNNSLYIYDQLEENLYGEKL